MFLLLLIFATSLFLAWVYVRWSKVKRYWADRGVPFVPPNPLLGNLTFLQRYNSGIWMRNLYHNYRTPYVGIWLFWRPALVVNSVEIGRRILISDATNFRDRLVTSGDSDPIGKHNLFTVKEPVWSSLRRRLTLVFTAAKLRSMHGLVEMKTRELIQRIQNDMTESNCVNLRKAFTDYTTDVIGGASLGFVGEATLTGRGPLRTVTQQFMDYDFFRGVSWLLMNIKCIFAGRRFALINLRCALAYMVASYKFRPLATTPPPARVQVERHSLFYSPGEPLLIEFKHRT
ncbi:PREDICTED: cytochrome P450 6k1-like [Papilio polytes]|uniref:cytochrome P450 6k1-like n=1 Tax=Papilio polytes TaxID=76194 RepID=UPI000676487D|nr:PREDICTED: cytochrome P450 6k1-like [Papilio polytes]